MKSRAGAIALFSVEGTLVGGGAYVFQEKQRQTAAGAALGPKPGHDINFVCGWCQELEAQGPSRILPMTGPLGASVRYARCDTDAKATLMTMQWLSGHRSPFF